MSNSTAPATSQYPPAFSLVKRLETPENEKWLVENGWRTPDTYDRDFGSLPDVPGIYVVLLLGYTEVSFSAEIVYVGMSTRLCNRITRHHEAVVAAQDECFAEYHPDRMHHVARYFRPADASEIRRLESEMIRAIGPRFNIIGTKEPISRRAA